MTGYIELHVPGERRVVVNVADVSGIMTSPKRFVGDIASKEEPLIVMLRSGSSIEVFGMSAEEVLAKCEMVKRTLKDSGAPVHTLWIDGHG